MRKRIYLFPMLIMATLAGCSDEVVVKRIKPQPATTGKVKEVADISAELADFKPPFPEHVALFEPEKNPTHNSGSTGTPAVAADAASEDSKPDIALVGFGAVDQQHALLMIDGRLEALRVGERYGAVHVLQISPPSVQLRVAGHLLEAKLSDEQGG